MEREFSNESDKKINKKSLNLNLVTTNSSNNYFSEAKWKVY